MYLINIVKSVIERRAGSVWVATTFSYIDRIMAFIMPLMVMKVIKKPEIYNSIEYVISLSILLSIFIDLGLKNYLIYFARQLGHKERAILLSISAFKGTSLIVGAI